MKIFSVLTFVLLSISPVHAFTDSFLFTPLVDSSLADTITVHKGINFHVASNCAITLDPIEWEVECGEYKLSFVTFTGNDVWIVPLLWIKANVHYLNEKTVTLKGTPFEGIPLSVTVCGKRTLYAPPNLSFRHFSASLSLAKSYTSLGF